MKYIQCICITLLVGCAYSGDFNSILFEKKELPLILANIQNQLSVITSANNLATAQISANSLALKNVQTQLDQIIATNVATKAANDANNVKLNSLILTLQPFASAVGAAFVAALPAIPGAAAINTAFQNLATAVKPI